MKVIFLDVDGVLNHEKCNGWFDAYCVIDPVCVMNLKRILDETGAEIVVSSTWRLSDNAMKTLLHTFKCAGIDGVFGKTPNLRTFDRRWSEIEAWMQNRPELTIEKFAILDDDWDASNGKDFFPTYFEDFGLTQEIAEAVINHLK